MSLCSNHTGSTSPPGRIPQSSQHPPVVPAKAGTQRPCSPVAPASPSRRSTPQSSQRKLGSRGPAPLWPRIPQSSQHPPVVPAKAGTQRPCSPVAPHPPVVAAPPSRPSESWDPAALLPSGPSIPQSSQHPPVVPANAGIQRGGAGKRRLPLSLASAGAGGQYETPCTLKVKVEA